MRWWSDLTTADFALDTARAIAVLPVAATEQHGPHLPLSVDTDIVNGVVAAALPHIAPDLPALFLPTQVVGFSPEHTRFAGTLTLKAETLIRVWTELGECVAASGVKKLVLLNSHGGQVGALDLVARDLRAPLGMLVYSVNWLNQPLLDAH
jgi:creatinine amidohydrolase